MQIQTAYAISVPHASVHALQRRIDGRGASDDVPCAHVAACCLAISSGGNFNGGVDDRYLMYVSIITRRRGTAREETGRGTGVQSADERRSGEHCSTLQNTYTSST